MGRADGQEWIGPGNAMPPAGSHVIGVSWKHRLGAFVMDLRDDCDPASTKERH